MTVKIDSNVPLPSARKGRAPKWPFRDMEIGDCFEFPAEKRASVASCGTYHSKQLGRKYATRIIDGVYRCWRIA